jgi:hypothetical protein
VSAHAVTIKTAIQCDAKTDEPTGIMRYRWICSCGRCGRWNQATKESGAHGQAAKSARVGGERHLAAAERAR